MKSLVTIISMTSFYGGGEEYIVRLINCLQEDFDITIIGCSELLFKKLEKNNVKLEFVKGVTIARYIKIYFKILQLPLRRSQVLLLNGQGPAYFAFFLPKLFKKMVYVHHTSLEYYNTPAKQKWVIQCITKVNSIVCVSNFLKNEINKYIKSMVVKVIYNWLPEDAVKSFMYKSDGVILKLIFIARLVEVKGILPLIEVVNKMPDVELYILGDGPLYDQITKKYSKCSNIHVLGWQNNKSRFLKGVHLNVVNSFSEGYSYTPVEAGVCGVPSLISDLEVHREICEDGKYAFLFKTGSEEDLKNKLLYLRDNRHLLEEMSAKCKAYYTNKFVFSDYKEQYIRELS